MDRNERPVSVGDWILTLFLAGLPIIGFILLLVWAFGGGASQSKSNWAKAVLIWMCIGFVISFLIFGLFFIIGLIASANS